MHTQVLHPSCFGILPVVLVLTLAGQQTTPVDNSARLAQIHRLYEQGKWSDAVSEANRLLDSRTRGEALAETLLCKGLAHGKRKEWGEAQASFKCLLVLAPDTAHAPEAAFRAGVVHLIRREPRLAHKVFDDLLRRYPASPWSARARRLSESG